MLALLVSHSWKSLNKNILADTGQQQTPEDFPQHCQSFLLLLRVGIEPGSLSTLSAVQG